MKIDQDLSVHWRLHEAIFTYGEHWSVMDNVNNFLASHGDTAQWINANNAFLLEPSAAHDQLAVAMTTLPDAKNFLRRPVHYGYPGAFFDDKTFSVSHWIAHLPLDIPFVNRHAILLPKGRLIMMTEDDIMPFARGARSVFIRPNSGMKAFTGDTVSCSDFTQGIQRLFENNPHVSDDELCAISPACELAPIEWRFWVVGGKISTYAPYSWQDDALENNDHTPHSKIVELAQRLTELDWDFGSTFVVDIGMYAGYDEAVVVEFNALSTSGLYPGVRIVDLMSDVRRHAITVYTMDQMLLHDDEG